LLLQAQLRGYEPCGAKGLRALRDSSAGPGAMGGRPVRTAKLNSEELTVVTRCATLDPTGATLQCSPLHFRGHNVRGPVQTSSIDASASRRTSSAILVLIFLGGLINYMDRAAMGVLAPLIRRDLGLDAAQLGLALGVFSIGYGIFTFAGGWAADRFGGRLVLGLSMLIWSVLCGLTGAVMGLMQLLVVRTAFGAGESPWIPASNKMLSQLVPESRFAAAFGISNAGQPIGAALAGPILAVATVDLGWRVAFVVIASIGLIWTAAWWLLTAKLSAGTVAKRPRARPQAALSVATAASPSLRLSRVLTEPAILATCFSLVAANYAQTFFLAWFPSYLRVERGLAQTDMSIMTVIPWALGALGLACGGLLSSYISKRVSSPLRGHKLMLTYCLIPGGICVALVPMVHSTHWAVGLMSTAIGLLFLAGPTYFATVHQVAPRRYLGSAIGMMVIFTTCAGVVSPILTGYLVKSSGGYASSFLVAATMLVAAALVFNVFARPRQVRREVTLV